MRMRALVVVVVASAASLLAGRAMAADHWLGTWKLDTAKSRYTPGPTPRSLSLKWEAVGGGMTHFVSDGVDGDGKATHAEFTSAFDGKDVAYSGNPNGDTAAPMRIDENLYTTVWKLKGSPMIRATVNVASDGKSLTVTQKGSDTSGRAVDVTAVYDRQ